MELHLIAYRCAVFDPSAAIFIDVEASGFGVDGGYPIEIGWADLSDNKEAVLIQPMDHWTFWSESAEQLHGISQAALRAQGIPADVAAQRVAKSVAGRLVHSDNPAHDRWWIARLFRDSGIALPKELATLQSTQQLITLLSQQKHLSYIDAMEIELEVKQIAPFKHRAGDDAAHWATIVRLTSERGEHGKTQQTE